MIVTMLDVPHDRMRCVLEVSPDLVATTGVWSDSNERVSARRVTTGGKRQLRTCQRYEVGNRFLSGFVFRRLNRRCNPVVRFFKRQIDRAGVIRKTSDDRNVRLLNFPAFKLCCQ